MKIKLYFFGTILVVLAILATIFSPSTDPISPLDTTLSPRSSLLESKSYIILGFAPYWNLKKISEASLQNITHFAYFNLHLNGDGSLYTKVNRREQDPGYTNYKRLLSGSVARGGKPLIITFMPESQDALVSSLTTAKNRQNTITTILNVVKESGASGVNIDYEPLGEIPVSVRDNFTLFIKELKISLQASSSSLLTISTYASAATRPRIWDLATLAASTDYFVIMTYDYTMPSSDSAGPTAPLRGSGNLFEHDVVKNIAEVSVLVPPAKILLGIPFYGYEWNTVDESRYSPVEARGSVASLDRVQEMLDSHTLSLLWDRNTLTPYGVSTQSGQTSQIYFENETSIRLKLEFVKSAGLGGIAIWALGYEGNTNWLWPTIQELNK